jgi:hypothetical protein
LFRCYVCSNCGHENLFVDLHPLEGEPAEDYQRRCREMEASIRQVRPAGVDVALIDKRTGAASSP